MNKLCYTGLFMFACTLLFCCNDREPINPLDPNNPNTQGKPYTIQANATGIGKVRLHWRKVNQSQVRSYRIYRSFESGTNSHIADVTDTLFIDTKLQPGKDYNYYYTLIWEDGKEIHKSPNANVITFDAPTGFTITKVARDRVEMEWDDFAWLDNYAYCRIYRNSSGTFSIYDSTTSNQYIDTNVDTGTVMVQVKIDF